MSAITLLWQPWLLTPNLLSKMSKLNILFLMIAVQFQFMLIYLIEKNTDSVERYVKQNLTKCQLSLCAQLSSGTSPLTTESGWFKKRKVCVLCELGEIDNDVHFMFNCCLYDDIRTTQNVLNQSRFLLTGQLSKT